MPYESTHFLLKIYRGTRISPFEDVNINMFKVIRILLGVGHLIMFYYYFSKTVRLNTEKHRKAPKSTEKHRDQRSEIRDQLIY